MVARKSSNEYGGDLTPVQRKYRTISPAALHVQR
jgi:hypothetical protein